MNIYFVRHGQTDWNVEKRLQGNKDIDLNQKGKEQAEQTRELLNNIPFNIIICSTLKRAKQTADIINNRNIPIVYDDRIKERDFGEFEGKKKDKMDYIGFWDYNKDYVYEKAENISIFFKRIYNFIDEVKNKYTNLNVLVVAHGGVSIPFYCYFNGMPDNGDLLSVMAGNCEFSKYVLKEENDVNDIRQL